MGRAREAGGAGPWAESLLREGCSGCETGGGGGLPRRRASRAWAAAGQGPEGVVLDLEWSLGACSAGASTTASRCSRGVRVKQASPARQLQHAGVPPPPHGRCRGLRAVFADKTELVIPPSHHRGILLRMWPCGSVTRGRSGKEIELSKGWGGGGRGPLRTEGPACRESPGRWMEMGHSVAVDPGGTDPGSPGYGHT